MTYFGSVFSYMLLFFTLSYNIDSTISVVKCPGKDVNEIRLQAKQFEVSFLFYHVSWSIDSQTARLVYEEVIRHYQEKIYFGLIDCYHLACNCSKTHPFSLGSGSPNRWPTLVISYGHRISINYNGEWNINALNRFIEALHKPVERLHTRDELKVLSMQRDAVVLGVFENATQSEYRIFVNAALKWLETDPEYSFRFANAIGTSTVNVLGKTNNTILSLPQLLLITSKGIDIMRNEWNVSNILLWLQSEFMRTFSILFGYNSPQSLAVHLHLSPVLVVIANDYFYEYMSNLTNPGNTYSKSTPNIWKWEKVEQQELEHVKYTLKEKQLSRQFHCYSKEYLNVFNLRYYYALNRHLSRQLCKISLSCANNETELEWMKKNVHTTCSKKAEISSPASKISAAKYLKKFVESNWRGYNSEQNQSLAVVILDSAKHFDFLQNLGIPDVEMNNSVTMIIADRLKESNFLFQGMFSRDRLEDFVQNYYNNALLAYKISSKSELTYSLPQSKVFLENVKSEIFLEKIKQINSTTIVLLYSPQCTFSALASQALIQLSTILDDTSGIQIIRLNTLTNELPWEFKMAKTPTLLVFPRESAGDSRKFPMHEKLDVRNILKFILAQMEPVDKLNTLLGVCKRRKLYSHGMRKCLQYVRTLADKYIADNRKLQRLFEKNAVHENFIDLNDISMELKTIFPFY
ncbi:thioredoxin domain-containing protein 11 [Eurosta solidaginis]|uniref:thioredoxin domain-containing protein 11 n=1 Tax=Eurosta solidaginis TaxID=178769 RepID=UPI0035308CB1